MNSSLSVEIQSRLIPVRESEWRRLIPGSPDPLELMRWVKRPDFNGFVFHSLVVRRDDHPILILPLFETECSLATVIGGRIGKLARIADRCFPNLLRIRFVGVGFVGGEWGEIGADAAVPRELLGQAWEMALESLDALADGLGASLLAWVNFTSHTGRMIPMNWMRAYAAISGVPGEMRPPCQRGSGSEQVSAHPSAEPISSVTLFKHRNPLVQRALGLVMERDTYSLNSAQPRAKLGSHWQ